MSDEIVDRGASWCRYCIDLWIDKREGKALFAVLVVFIFCFCFPLPWQLSTSSSSIAQLLHHKGRWRQEKCTYHNVISVLSAYKKH